MAFVSGDRRRRVLTEQLVAGSTATDAAATAAGAAGGGAPVPAGPAYEADTIQRLARVSDLVPHRRGFFLLYWLALVGWGGGLIALHIYSLDWTDWLSEQSLATLSLTAPRGLGSWFATVLLLSAAMLSALIYTVRRHRTDDYQGRYRLWATASFCWFLLSLFSATGTGEILREAGTRYTAWHGWREGTLWWLGPIIAIYGVALLRMSLDMRRAPLSFLTLALAVGCWSAALAIEFDWLTTDLAPLPLLQAGLMMAGHLLLVAALLTYARLVVLQAAGKIAAVAIPRKKKEDGGAKKKRGAKSAKSTKAKSTAKSPDGKTVSTKKNSLDEQQAETSDRREGKSGSFPANRSTPLTLGRGSAAQDDETKTTISTAGRNSQGRSQTSAARRSRENRAA